MGAIAQRRVNTGLDILAGKSAAQAMVRNGYSPATAHNPTANGVQHCVAAALKAHPEANPSNLVSAARVAMARKLASLNSPGVDQSTVKLGELARTMDVIERFHGAGAAAAAEERETRTLAQRVAAFQAVAKLYEAAQARAAQPRPAVTGDAP